MEEVVQGVSCSDEELDGKNIEVHKFDNATDLINTLFAADPIIETISRGQGDSLWGLKPSILRGNGKASIVEPDFIDSELKLTLFELNLISIFLEKADEAGLSVPSDSLTLRKQLSHFDDTLKDFQVLGDKVSDQIVEELNSYPVWPWAEAISIMALMQHHGLPTRLLDWTLNPLHAAYFAAKQAVSSGASEGYLAVFVLNKNSFSNWDFKYADGYDKLLLVSPPAAGNSNLTSQRGLFSFYRRRLNGKIEDSARGHELFLPNQVGLLKKYPGKKYFLPKNKAYALLDLLHCHNIHSGTLFPNWDGISDSIFERFTIIKNCSL